MIWKLKEWFSIRIAREPGRVILAGILIFNILFIFLSSIIISHLSLDGTENMNFLEAAFCTMTMILDAGCISFVVSDIGHIGVGVALLCLVIIIIGMISFTGAMIGYITNSISHFIEASGSGGKKLALSGHIVLLNWNIRASETVNDLLFNERPQKVVVLSGQDPDRVRQEIDDRLRDTLLRENHRLKQKYQHLSPLKRWFYYRKNRLRNRVTVIVRQGDIFVAGQLRDLCVDRAATVILFDSGSGSLRRERYGMEPAVDSGCSAPERNPKGSALTIKTLMQVTDVISSGRGSGSPVVIVEIMDARTGKLVEDLIESRMPLSGFHIVPMYINQISGQILSQFSLIPELSSVYGELFSNKGATIYSRIQEKNGDHRELLREEIVQFTDYLKDHVRAIPLSLMETENGICAYYEAGSEKDLDHRSVLPESGFRVHLNRDYWIGKKKVILMGHNSRCIEIMEGFCAFRQEWNFRDGSDEILEIVVIDSRKNLEKMRYYEDYPFVTRTVEADLYDSERICDTIRWFIGAHEEDTSILVLSDDAASGESVDENVLLILLYIQKIIQEKILQDPEFEEQSVDVIAEILDPRHYNVVRSCGIRNVVISNRYISKMMTRIGENEALSEFYRDILTYDTEDQPTFMGKEIYVKKVKRFFKEIPGECTAAELIREVYRASMKEVLSGEELNPVMTLGYIRSDGEMTIFRGDQRRKKVRLAPEDKLIVVSNH